MRKVLFLLLSLLLLISVGALAEPTPSNVAITIDGVRTAFFDDAGNYLSPLEENGIIYVPVQQLAESLGLDVTTDVEKLAVTLNGVRTAFFAEDGTYLPPLNVNGILYAPLDAFIESAGIAVEKADGKYGFARIQTSDPQSEDSSLPKVFLTELLTSEPWLEAFAPDDKVTFNNDGTALNEYMSNGQPHSTTYKWEATGNTTFNLFVMSYEIGERNGVTVFNSTYDRTKFFVRESEYEKAVAVLPTPVPTPTPTPQPTPTPDRSRLLSLEDMIETKDFRLTIERACLTSVLVYETEERTDTRKAKEGMQFFTLIGSFNNIGGKELRINNIKTEMILDDKYSYSGSGLIGISDCLTYSIPPVASGLMYLYAEIPDAVAKSFTTADITIGFEDELNTVFHIEKAKHIYKMHLGTEYISSAKHGLPRTNLFYSECPALPLPSNYTSIIKEARFSSKNETEYWHKCLYEKDDLHALIDIYKAGLKADGYNIKGNTISLGKKKLATIEFAKKFDTVFISVLDGNESLSPPAAAIHINDTSAPSDASAINNPIPSQDSDSIADQKLVLGESVRIDDAEIKFIEKKTTTGSLRYSQGVVHLSVEPRNNGILLYIRGSYKNLNTEPFDLENAEGMFVFNDSYQYKATVVGVRATGNWANKTIVSPMDTQDFYMYAEIPKNMMDSYTSCTAFIGFGDDVTADDPLPDFSDCTYVFEIDLSSNTRSSKKYDLRESESPVVFKIQPTPSPKPTSSPAPKPTPTIKPSANQEYQIMLGFSSIDVTEENSKEYSMPCGLGIIEIDSKSAAEQAGLRTGDIIIAFAGKKVMSKADLIAIKTKLKPGDIVSVVVNRKGREITLDIVIPQPILVDIADLSYDTEVDISKTFGSGHHIRITGSGTINVRSKPDPKSSRVGHVKSGETYELLETASNGWFKIRLKDGKKGYVSGNMAEKID